MPTEGGRVRDALEPAVESLPELLYRGPREPDRPLTAVSSGAPRVSGYERDTFESGDLVWGDVIHPDDRETAWRDVEAALDGGANYDVTYRIVTADDDVRWVRDRGEGLPDGTLSGYVEDVTRLKEREVQLAAELDETLKRISDAFFALDRDWEFTYVNDTAEEFLERDREELLGADVWSEFPDAAAFREQYERAMETQESVTFTELYEPLDTHFEVSAYPSETGLSVYFRDVTERVDRENRLERHEAIVETIRDGVYALDEDERFTIVNAAFCEMLGLDRETLLGRHIDDVFGEAIPREAERFTEEIRRGERESATLSFTVEADGETRPVEVRFGPFPDGGRVGVFRDVTERRERSRKLRAQRERLDRLVELYDVASAVSHAAVEQTNRSAVEERAVEELAAYYGSAWVGRTAGMEVTRVASAGGDAPSGDLDLGRRAIEEGRVVVAAVGDGDTGTVEARGDGGTAADREVAAAVPITYEGGVYGVLVAGTERSDAFGDAERTVLDRLGTTLGHAIAALERRAALLSDRVVQVKYRSTSVDAALDLPSADSNVEFRFERTVVTGDGSYVHYVHISGMSGEQAVELFERSGTYEHVRLVGEYEDHVLVEAATTEAQVTTTVADHGGRLTSVTVKGGELHIVAEFPQGVDLRRVTESVREEVPDVELVAQRSIDREGGTDETRVEALSGLTDRQRAAFESAYYGGYFEWPRDSTAEELAEAMGVSAPTFHQHLRAAERKLLGEYAE